MTFKIELSEQQLSVINALLVEAPYRVAAPLINSFNEQINTQKQKTEEHSEDDVTNQAIGELATSVRRW